MTTSDSTPDRVKALNELRDTLARSIDECESMRDLASLSREYRAVMAEITELSPVEEKGDVVDEIAKRRAARRSRSSKSSGRTGS